MPSHATNVLQHHAVECHTSSSCLLTLNATLCCVMILHIDGLVEQCGVLA